MLFYNLTFIRNRISGLHIFALLFDSNWIDVKVFLVDRFYSVSNVDVITGMEYISRWDVVERHCSVRAV